MGDIGRLTFIGLLGILKRSRISQFRFQKVYRRRSGYSTLYKNMVNVGPVTPECVHPSSISSLAASAWRRHC